VGPGKNQGELGLAEDLGKAWSHQGKGIEDRNLSSWTKNIIKGCKQEKKPDSW